MATSLAPLADDDLGTDVALTEDLSGVWGVASARTNLAMAIYRRLSTTRGGLFYDADYGFNLTDLLNSELSTADISAARGAIIAECQKDERVQSASVILTFRPLLKSLDVEIEIDTAVGPFDLVLRATAVTVDILRLAGQDVVATAARPDAVVVQVPGPQGLTGATGSGGGGGSAVGAGIFNQSEEKSVVSTAEEVIFQDSMPFSLLGPTITMQLTAMILSLSGTSTFRVRYGGTDGVADGTLFATLTRSLSTYAMAAVTATAANPTGLLFVKVTAQNPVLGQAAKIKDIALTVG
jgi:hypothetical protein